MQLADKITRSSALPRPSCLRVYHLANHTLLSLVLLLGEGPLCGKSGFLLICHSCTHTHKKNATDWSTLVGLGSNYLCFY